MPSTQYTQTFAYDTLNRLTSMTSSGATGASPGSYTYGDSAHLHAATATAGGYSATYDAACDMVCRAPTSATTCTGGSPTGAQLAYDAERRLTHYQNIPGASPDVEAWYLYDGDGNRVEQAVKQVGVVTSTYYLPKGVEEVRSDGSLIKYYTALGVGLGLNTAHDASGISFQGDDGLGSIQVTLNSSGGAVASTLDAPYGAVRYSNGTMPAAKGFTGQYSDTAVSGLDYYVARYYDPSLGQFTSADSVVDGFNRYGYVGGNPETKTDPTGHCPWCIAALVGAAVGAVVVYGTQVASNVQNGGSLTDLSTWKPTDGGAILKGALVGAAVGATMGAIATVATPVGGTVMGVAVTEGTLETASTVVSGSLLGAADGLVEGAASGDTGGDLVWDMFSGSASGIVGGVLRNLVGNAYRGIRYLSRADALSAAEKAGVTGVKTAATNVIQNGMNQGLHRQFDPGSLAVSAVNGYFLGKWIGRAGQVGYRAEFGADLFTATYEWVSQTLYKWSVPAAKNLLSLRQNRWQLQVATQMRR